MSTGSNVFDIHLLGHFEILTACMIKATISCDKSDLADEDFLKFKIVGIMVNKYAYITMSILFR